MYSQFAFLASSNELFSTVFLWQLLVTLLIVMDYESSLIVFAGYAIDDKNWFMSELYVLYCTFIFCSWQCPVRCQSTLMYTTSVSQHHDSFSSLCTGLGPYLHFKLLGKWTYSVWMVCFWMNLSTDLNTSQLFGTF